MSNYIILNKRKNIRNVSSIIQNLNLKKSLKNKRTTIWENKDIQVSIDRSLIRILIYSRKDIAEYKKLFNK